MITNTGKAGLVIPRVAGNQSRTFLTVTMGRPLSALIPDGLYHTHACDKMQDFCESRNWLRPLNIRA